METTPEHGQNIVEVLNDQEEDFSLHDHSFMLYRKHSFENNPSLLFKFNNMSASQRSQVIASAWAKEPEEVKLKFEVQAQIDRQNFIKAFPDYQYTRANSKSMILRLDEMTTAEGRARLVSKEET
ncbi:hypothetical protein BGX28_003955 [Mortierella sp. GBA30]|nr:hypothetical protein BGX28_003955 [Mortierella sp. GBA30]